MTLPINSRNYTLKYFLGISLRYLIDFSNKYVHLIFPHSSLSQSPPSQLILTPSLDQKTNTHHGVRLDFPLTSHPPHPTHHSLPIHQQSLLALPSLLLLSPQKESDSQTIISHLDYYNPLRLSSLVS